VRENGSFAVDHFSRRTTRIGARLDRAGGPAPAAVKANIDALSACRNTIRLHRCDGVFAFGTHAFRRLAASGDSAAVGPRLERAIGVPIRVLTGREEARFAYLSAHANLPLVRPRTVLIDIGGGSTELVVADRGRVRNARSLPLGALHLTERFIHTDPIDNDEFLGLTRHVDRMWRAAVETTGLSSVPPRFIDLAASGGTIGSLARMISGRAPAAGRRKTAPPPSEKITSAEAGDFLNRCLALTLRERKRIQGLDPERADIICAGLAVVVSMMRTIRKRTLFANSGGVREGVLIHLIRNGLRW
jgi:exopolyphosphatase/guanosine-5'-triphosphate,3'-diphosphate pyrophosphatase